MKGLLFLVYFIGLSTLVLIYLVAYKGTTKQKSKVKVQKYKLKNAQGSNWYQTVNRYLVNSDQDMSVEMFLVIHVLFGTLIGIVGLNQFLLFGFKALIQTGFMLLISAVMPLHVFMLYKRKERNQKIVRDLSNAIDLLYFQSRFGQAEDAIFFACAGRVGEPLKQSFEKLGAAYKTKSDVKPIYKQMRALADVQLLHSVVTTLESRMITGKSEESLKTLKEHMLAGKLSSYRVKRDIRRLQLILGTIGLSICFVVLLVLPQLIEVRNDLNIIIN